jgi:hypothetical protein
MAAPMVLCNRYLPCCLNLFKPVKVYTGFIFYMWNFIMYRRNFNPAVANATVQQNLPPALIGMLFGQLDS